MPRFFVAGSNLAGGVALIAGADAEHIKVLRMKLGERLVVCDGAGKEYDCRLTKLGDGTAEAEILSERSSPAEPSLRCVVLAAFPKGDKAEYIVQKCTECGAAEIVFFPAYRCVAKPEGKSLERKLERWQRIAAEAAKQSGRALLPQIEAPLDFSALCRALPRHALALAPWEEQRGRGIAAQWQGQEDVALVIGPEGGISAGEIEALAAAGAVPVTLGPRILRTETAGLAALISLLTLSGDME
jgi:16S rRNA (uracil1498-N3)-methyltransferase